MIKVVGEHIPNMPWEDRPQGKNANSPVWRYSKNPVIGRNPAPNVSRIFNSAVASWKDGGFVGVFRAETCSGIPYLYYGFSEDALEWFNTTLISLTPD